MPWIDWSKSIAITWDEKRRERSVVRVPGIKVPAGPPTVRSRRARWELSSFYPRVFGAAYRFPLDTVAVNRGLKDGRGRTLVARDLDEPSGQMPLAVISWHLSQRLEDPLLVIADDHRAWVLKRLPARARERKRAEAQLGSLLFDVEGQDALATYLRGLYDTRLSVSVRVGRAPKWLRLAP